ncbi:hypothetical protein GCM10009722_04170 [Williamsia deligens]
MRATSDVRARRMRTPSGADATGLDTTGRGSSSAMRDTVIGDLRGIRARPADRLVTVGDAGHGTIGERPCAPGAATVLRGGWYR